MSDTFHLASKHELSAPLVITAIFLGIVLAVLGNWFFQWFYPLLTGNDPGDFLDFLNGCLSSTHLGLSSAPFALLGSAIGVGVIAYQTYDMSAVDEHSIDADESEGDQKVQDEAAWAPYAHTTTTIKVDGKKKEWPCPVECEQLSDDNMLLTENAKVALSNCPDRRWRPPNHHAFVIAGSGSGKTFNFVTSNVLQANASYVFTDPKGELLARFGKFLVRHGYAVRFIDLRPDEKSILTSFHWNPLHYCQSGTQVDDFISRLIAATSSPESKNANSDFFTNMEKLAYGALMKMELFWFGKNGHPEDYNVPSIYDWLGMLKTTGGAESELYDVFFGTKGGLSYEKFVRGKHPGLTDDELRLSPEWEAIADFQGFMSDADSPETAASVLSSCYNRLHPFMNYAVRTILSGNDEMDLDKLGTRKQAIFMITADSGGPYDFLAAILTSQIFSINARIGDDSPGHHLPVPVICYLDELANIGKLPNLDKLFATLRSRGINLVAITQYSDQLKTAYGEGARGIMANCSIIEYLGAGDLKTCEDVSKMLGEKTVHYIDYSVSRSQTGGSVTESVRRVKQAVYTPQQLFNISTDPNRCLVHLSNAGWIEGKKPNPMQHPRWHEIGGDNEVTDFAAFSQDLHARLHQKRLPAAGEVAKSNSNKKCLVVTIGAAA